MNLYFISQDEYNGHDTYSDAVVCAEDEHEARNIHPNGKYAFRNDGWYDKSGKKRDYNFGEWASTPANVKLELIGTAKEGIKKGVVCASFHAG